MSWPDSNSTTLAEGKATYGEAFIHMHHYCWAMIWQMRAERAGISQAERRGALLSVVGNIDYVLRQPETPADHFLLPEMLTRKAKALRLLNELGEAIEALKSAIDLNKKYWRAYSELALCYEITNDRKQAVAALREGLDNNPGAKALTLHLETLERGTSKTVPR